MHRYVPLLFAMVLASPPAFGNDPPTDLGELIGKVKKHLPKGWEVSINPPETTSPTQKKGVWDVVVFRATPVFVFEEIAPNPPALQKPKPEQKKFIYFNLRVIPFVSQKEFDRRVDHNNRIITRRKLFTKNLKDIPRHGKAAAFEPFVPSGYFPRTDEQKRRVKDFREWYAKNEKLSLPDYRYAKRSFDFTNWANNAKDKRVRKEAAAARMAFEKVISKYDRAKTR